MWWPWRRWNWRKTKSLSEKGGDVELYECGGQGGAMGEEKLVQVQEEDSTIGHI